MTAKEVTILVLLLGAMAIDLVLLGVALCSEWRISKKR